MQTQIYTLFLFQVRWGLETVNRVFCPKTISKKDKDKILVIITKRLVWLHNETKKDNDKILVNITKRIVSKASGLNLIQE